MGDTDTMSTDDSSDDDFDDFVTLGKLSNFKTKIKWQFPNTTICPSCGISCSSRNVALVHFRSTHADKSMICVLCNILFDDAAKLLYHHAVLHPNHPPPKLRENTNMTVVKKNIVQPQKSDDSEEVEEDDLIILHGCGRTTHWRFPPNLTHCPVKGCLLQFGVRSDVITHYRKRHAHNAILCPLCDKPIMCQSISGCHLKTHYSIIHPTENLPYNLSAKVKPENAKTNIHKDMNTTSKNVQDDDEIDDFITLHAYGQTTHWRFPPNLKRCPVSSCHVEFGVRSDAINHYKKRHANQSILCPICVKPILCGNRGTSDFKAHYRKIHPSERLPYNFNVRIKPEAKAMSEDAKKGSKNQRDDVEEDDSIILHGCNRTTRWRFPPNLKFCPVLNCSAKFGVRSDAINHYKKQHANHSILCPICVKPIMCKKRGSSHFRMHYRKIHPSEGLPYNLKATIKPEAKKNIGKNTNTACETEEDDDEEDDLITLNTYGITTDWRFPPNLKRCPVSSCLLQFGVRSDVINHYRKRHANHAILCPICDKPILCKNRGLSNFKDHYKKVHPSRTLPYNLKATIKPEIKKETKKSAGTKYDSEEQWRNDEDVDDLIILKGLGETTFWHFPKHINHCPVAGCGLMFPSRLGAINHYKKRHADRFILCSICVKPISTDSFPSHYRSIHPDTEMPSYIKDRAKRATEQLSGMKKNEVPILKNNNKVDQCEDDLITLYGCGKQSKWRFPKGVKSCPARICHLVFETRQEAIFHFKEQHAKHFTLCPLCKKPIGVKSPYLLQIHYKKMHSNEKLSSGGKKKIKAPCNICGKKMLAHYIPYHIREMHTSEMFICPLKGCEFGGKRQSYVRHHWNREHPNLEFPQIRKESKFRFKIRTPRNVKQEAQASNTPVSTVTSNAAVHQETSNTSVQQDVSNTSVQQDTPNIQAQQETPTTPTRQEDNESDENLLIPLRTASETSSSDEEINLHCPDCDYVSKTVFALKMHRDKRHNVLRKRKKKRMPPRSYNDSTTETDDEQVKKTVKRRRLIKKRQSDSGIHDSRDETPIRTQSEDLSNSTGHQKSTGTLPAPSNIVQAEVDPLALDLPMDLSIPKTFYVLDSEEEANLLNSSSEDDVKPTITSEGNAN